MKIVDEFLSQYPTRKFAAGETILELGERVKYVYVIKKGVIKVFDINKDGEVKIILYDGEYECLPIAAAFNKSDYALYYYEAFYDCELYVIPREDYVPFVTGTPEVAFFTMDRLVDRYLDFSRRINGLTQIKGEQKVLYTLDFLCRRFARSKRHLDSVELTIPLSQVELANMVGLTRETVSTVMNSLRKKKVVRYKGMNGIKINLNKLKELTEI